MKDKRIKTRKQSYPRGLAEQLGVSFQAVSRWENSVTFPDITMLPLLANMFDVTVDYLLDVDTYNKEKEIPDIIVQSIVLFN
ncbi:MAG: helix-turn-helix transcriptional regulator [Staphylococcus sp.]|nr:helix-turn-helix transcriptional regulator [Staphylococcus sp.]